MPNLGAPRIPPMLYASWHMSENKESTLFVTYTQLLCIPSTWKSYVRQPLQQTGNTALMDERCLRQNKALQNTNLKNHSSSMANRKSTSHHYDAERDSCEGDWRHNPGQEVCTEVVHLIKTGRIITSFRNCLYYVAMSQWIIANPFAPKFKKYILPEMYSISGVARIVDRIIFHPSKLWKAKFFILYDAIFLVRLQGKFQLDHSWEWKAWRPIDLSTERRRSHRARPAVGRYFLPKSSVIDCRSTDTSRQWDMFVDDAQTQLTYFMRCATKFQPRHWFTHRLLWTIW